MGMVTTITLFWSNKPNPAIGGELRYQYWNAEYGTTVLPVGHTHIPTPEENSPGVWVWVLKLLALASGHGRYIIANTPGRARII